MQQGLLRRASDLHGCLPWPSLTLKLGQKAGEGSVWKTPAAPGATALRGPARPGAPLCTHTSPLD